MSCNACEKRLKGSPIHLLFLCKINFRLTPNIEQYERKMSAADYESKVPESVRTLNAEKLTAYKAELSATMEAIEVFKKLQS